jgi:predicted enzyme related to lactoylglutathione lyase
MKHAINWFEIPAADFDRAVAFYNTILDASLRKEVAAGVPNGILPYEQDDSHTAIGGAVISDDRINPGMSGIVPYLNCTGKLDAVLSRVPAAGGKVLMPATQTPFGSIAMIVDSEGNRIGLHSY